METGKVSIQIRGNVFETNSSSSHSLTVMGSEQEDFGFERDELRNGVIDLAWSDDFGWRWEKLDSTHAKIAYLLIQTDPETFGDDVKYGDNIVSSLVEKNEKARWLVNLIEEATGCTLNWEYQGQCIDHQSHGIADDMFFADDYAKSFLFCKDSYIQTGNDNEDPYEYR